MLTLSPRSGDALRVMWENSQGSLRSLRQGNRERLLGLLRGGGAMHRAELARRAGLSRSTVSTIVASLLEEGLVIEAADGDTHGQQSGRPGELLTLNPAGGGVLGLDFSYREVRVAVADVAHRVLADAVADLAPDQSWVESLRIGEELVDRVLAESGFDRSQVLGAGLGVPGPIDQTSGEVGVSSNSLGWVGVHAADELSNRLRAPVAMDNTAHLGSLAEAVWGAGQGCRNSVYLKLSSGVGGGFIFDGRVFRGSIGAAGEIGHLMVDEGGPACRCGGRGCLEVYASVPAVLETLRPLMGEDVTLDTVLTASAEGNRACRRVLGDAGAVVGQAMASVCNVLNPERIIVGGGLAPAGDALFEPMRTALDRHALKIVADNVQILPARLGSMAGALGGIALVLREADRLVSADGEEPSIPSRARVAHG